MNKIMLSLVASAAIVTVASADTAWFNGNIGSSATGGAWTVPDAGVTLDTNKYVLDDPETALTFAAETSKTLSSSENLKFATNAKFSYSYDELPEVPANAKAGIVVSDDKYFVLMKDGDTNIWFDTEIAASDLDAAVDIEVTITNGTDGAHALYKIGATTVDKVVAASETWGSVDYKGCGEVASLVGTTISQGIVNPDFPLPIPQSVADAWLEANPSKTVADLEGNDDAYAACVLGINYGASVNMTCGDTSSSTVDLALDVDPAVPDAVKYQLFKDGDAQGEAGTEKTFTPAIADGVYQIKAKIGTKFVAAANKIGVKGSAVTNGKVAWIPVSWGASGTINVKDILKKSLLAEDDKIEIFNGTTLSYDTWIYAKGEWCFVGDSEPAGTLAKGQAVKFIRAGDTGTMYAVGEVAEDVTSVTITAGVDKWNLVGNPSGSMSVSKLPLDGAKAQAIILNDTGTAPAKIIQKFNDTYYSRPGYSGSWTEVTEPISGGVFLKTHSATQMSF